MIMDVAMPEWKRTLLSIGSMSVEGEGCVEKLYSSLKRLVQLSLDIQNRLVQSSEVKVHNYSLFHALFHTIIGEKSLKRT